MKNDYIIKRITNLEISDFQNLIKKHWVKRNHIFSKKKDIVNFYYNFRNNKNTNILGLYKKNKLCSVMGLIPSKNWDLKLKKDYFIAFLLKSKSVNDSTFNFLNYIYKKINPNFLAVSGINMETSGKIFERLGEIKFFSHYYILNPQIKSKLTKNLKYSKLKTFNDNLKILISNKIIKMPFSKFKPKKSKNYFENKYLKNPYYNYYIMNFFNSNKLVFFFVFRQIQIKKLKRKILRVIDFQGDIPKKASMIKPISEYLIENNIEYLDMMCHGFPKKSLEDLGFLLKKKNQKIPDHFEPFTGRDAELNFSIIINKYKRNIILLKGDGDQDRPNLPRD